MKSINFFDFKIRNKIILISIAQFIVVIILISFILNLFILRQINQNIKNNLVAIAQSRSSHIETYLKDNTQLLQLVTSRTALRKTLSHYNETSDEADLLAITNIIKDAIIPISQFERICILSLDGTVLASTNEKYCGNNIKGAKFFIDGFKSESIYFLEEDGVYKIYISGPMILDGEVIGVGMTVLNSNDLEGIIKNRTGLGKTGEALIAFYNESGERKYPFKRLFEENALILGSESEETAYPMKQALIGQTEYFENILDYRNKKVSAASTFIKSANLGLVVKIDRTEILEARNQLFLFFIAISIIFILIYYFLSKRISIFISKPMLDLLHGTEEVARGNFEYKVGTKMQDEIGQLSRSFDNMVEFIKESRADIDKKVKEQTKEIIEKKKYLESQQKATLNVLADVEEEKVKTDALLSSIGEGVIATDVNANIIFLNKSAEDILGWKAGEVIGKNIYEFLEMVDGKGKVISEENRPFYIALNTKRKFIAPMQTSRYYTKKNGQVFPVAVTVTPVILDNGIVIGAINIFRDISHEREVDKVKTEFVSLASHQLRTPLSAINWYTEMLLAGDAGKISKEQRKYLDEVYKSNKRMVELVNALLNVSRIDLGTFTIVPEACNLSEISDSVLSELVPGIEAKKMKIEKKYDQKLPKINVDQKLTRIIFQNLLTNAIKYTPENGKISLSIEKQGENALIKVKDNGYGIPKNDQLKIFQKLFRADNIREKETDGTGLGLYIVKSILENSGGSISFESEENIGTTFIVTIPLLGMAPKEGSKGLS
jgi:PAS domain S-box-containing protein